VQLQNKRFEDRERFVQYIARFNVIDPLCTRKSCEQH